MALHYFQINSLQSEISLERSQRREESLKLIEQRRRAGTVSELAVAQTASLLATAEARLFAAERIQNSLLYSLAALLGETPATFSYQPEALESAPPAIPAGLPGELLARRPDIRRSERLLAETNALVGVAKAGYFPRITLSGTLGFAVRDWDDMFESISRFESAGAGVSVPVFQGGRLGPTRLKLEPCTKNAFCFIGKPLSRQSPKWRIYCNRFACWKPKARRLPVRWRRPATLGASPYCSTSKAFPTLSLLLMPSERLWMRNSSSNK